MLKHDTRPWLYCCLGFIFYILYYIKFFVLYILYLYIIFIFIYTLYYIYSISGGPIVLGGPTTAKCPHALLQTMP